MILWSHVRGLGNCATSSFSSEKTSRYSWNFSGICFYKGKISFSRLISASIAIALVDFELIQILLSVSPVIVEINTESSVSSKGFCVELRCSSSSFSSVQVVLSCVSFRDIVLFGFVCVAFFNNRFASSRGSKFLSIFVLFPSKRIFQFSSWYLGSPRSTKGIPKWSVPFLIWSRIISWGFFVHWFPSRVCRKSWSFLVCFPFHPHCMLKVVFLVHMSWILLIGHSSDQWTSLQRWCPWVRGFWRFLLLYHWFEWE